jgi:hypothetical protein
MRLTILTAALLSIATGSAPAVAQAPDGQPACAPIADIEAKLAAEYQETRVQQGIVGDGRAMLLIFAAPEGKTWTAVMLRHDGVGCMAAAGTDWQVRNDAPAVPEQGS